MTHLVLKTRLWVYIVYRCITTLSKAGNTKGMASLAQGTCPISSPNPCYPHWSISTPRCIRHSSSSKYLSNFPSARSINHVSGERLEHSFHCRYKLTGCSRGWRYTTYVFRVLPGSGQGYAAFHSHLLAP